MIPSFVHSSLSKHNSTTLRYQKASTSNTSPKKSTIFHPDYSTMPRSMVMILTTAFISVTALALPDVPPTAPPSLSSGDEFFDGLIFKPYKGVDCHGEPAAVYDGQYGRWEAFQMQSYSLNRPLLDGENLDFYSGRGTDGNINYTVDNSKSGHFSVSCLQFDLRAGVNATTSDTGNHPKLHGKNQGCHTLVHNEWCANIWIGV